MGFLLSCCRRRSPDEEDHEPLLSRPSPIHDELLPPESYIDKAADIFAALHVGKLPSQDQTNTALRKVLRSNILLIRDSKSARVLGQNHQYGPLSDRSKKILSDIRTLIEAVIQFGLEKNDDDKVQDLIYQISQIGESPVSVDLDAAKDTKTSEEIHSLAEAIPSFEELDKDTRRLSDALFTLSRVLLTSSNFRYLLSDILLTSRALLADAAADLGQVAQIVEKKADAVEHAIRPGNKETDSTRNGMNEAATEIKGGIKDIGEETKEKWQSLGPEASDRLKEFSVDTLQKVLAQAQQEPEYKSALHTLIYLLGKYVERMSTAASAVSFISTSATTVPTPVIATDPNLKDALTDFRILLERLASGRSLATLITHLEHTLMEITTESSPKFQSDLRQFYEDLRSGIERVLGEPGFSISTEGHDLAQQLFERGQTLMRSNSVWSKQANEALKELDDFINRLKTDGTTRRVVDALDSLSKDTADLFQVVAGVAVKRQRELREELKKDLIGWMLPRVLSMLETLPMPRVEMKSEALECVVDALILSATASFLPDHVLVQNYNEVRMEASAAAVESSYANGAGVQAASRTRIHADGLRIAAHRVGYYVQYKGPFSGLCSWEDSGLIDVDVGRKGVAGKGVSVDIELETTSEDEEEDRNAIFRVNDVKVDVSGLRVSISKSRHWIFNTIILQPLAGPIVKRMLRRVLASQIRTGLENTNERLSAVRSEVNRRVKSRSKTEGGASMEDYWKALCVTVGSFPTDKDSEARASTVIESETQVTLRGVVRNTRTQTKVGSSSPQSPSETVVAVGIGPQILPGKGGPEPGVDSATDQARGALSEVEDSAEHAAGKAKAVADNVVEAAETTRESLEDASARMEARESVEAKKKGWRSSVFDF